MNRLPALAVVLSLASLLAACTDPAPEDIAWLDRHAVPLDGADPSLALDDLAPLAAMFGDARIVGLGESTHGTREHFQLKHRLVRFLVQEQGFDIFAIEASTPEAHRLDAYVLGEVDADPAQLIGGMYFWTWNTEEVLAMVEWMRAHNERSQQKVHFTGFDMQTPDVAAEEVVAFLETVDPARAADVASRYAPLMTAQRASPFATATYTFPVDEARGKTARFHGWIRTEDVDGFAGLWWRIDGEQNGSLGFDNMSDRKIAGTTEWTEYAIEMPVPAEAININFGFLLSGTGTAWFDGAIVELDGKPYSLDDLDLDFESDTIKAAYATHDAGYTSFLDPDVAHTGHQSLRLASASPDEGAVGAAEAAEEARAVLAELQGQRTAWLTEQPSDVVERALFNARIVHQCLSARAAAFGNPRDAFMAENVAWLTEQHPEARIVLWAHNFHVSREEGAMGADLDARFGDAYLPVGFATASGRYYAYSRSDQRIHELQLPPDDSFEARFVQAEAPMFALDLRIADPGSAASGWLCEERPFRLIGAMAMDEQFQPTRLRDLFDLVVFVAESQAARQLDTPPGRP